MILKNYIIQARFSKNKQSHTLTKNITLLLKIPFSIVIFIVFFEYTCIHCTSHTLTTCISCRKSIHKTIKKVPKNEPKNLSKNPSWNKNQSTWRSYTHTHIVYRIINVCSENPVEISSLTPFFVVLTCHTVN